MRKILRRLWNRYVRRSGELLLLGELPEGFEDAMITHTDITFGWRDAIGILLGCNCTLKCITYTEHRPGNCKSVSQVSVWNPTQPFTGGFVEVAANKQA
jgi:hypothetical protein